MKKILLLSVALIILFCQTAVHVTADYMGDDVYTLEEAQKKYGFYIKLGEDRFKYLNEVQGGFHAYGNSRIYEYSEWLKEENRALIEGTPITYELTPDMEIVSFGYDPLVDGEYKTLEFIPIKQSGYTISEFFKGLPKEKEVALTYGFNIFHECTYYKNAKINNKTPDTYINSLIDCTPYETYREHAYILDSPKGKEYVFKSSENPSGKTFVADFQYFIQEDSLYECSKEYMDDYSLKYNVDYSSDYEYMWMHFTQHGADELYIFKIKNTPQNESNSNSSTSFGSPVSDWAKDEVEDAYDDGLIPETLVGKDLTKKINRSEFAAVAVLIYEKLINKSVSTVSTPFIDIKDDINKKEISKAYKLGITVGTSATTFDPLRNITREELATMLCRGIKKYKFPDWTPETDYMYYMQGISGKKFADDNEISDYARDSVYFMSSAAIIKGIDATHFAPKASVTHGDALDYGMATREQAIIMAKRIKENKLYFDDI